jgi:hypothetical protein
VQSPPHEISGFISRIVECCLDIRAIWHIGHDEAGAVSGTPRWELLAFADEPTLRRLRKSADLHTDEIDVLVVIDGDRFENAWGQRRLSGSLVRWGWQQVRPAEAYYNEARWGGQTSDGGIVRIRRKAILVWQSRDALVAHR